MSNIQTNSDTIKIFVTPRGQFAVNTVTDAKLAAVFSEGRHHQNEVLDVLSAFVTKESIIVDGGAHIGSIAVPLAAQARQVIAFEPDSASFSLLAENARLNGASLDLRNRGLGSEAAHASIRCVRMGNAGSNTLFIGEGSIQVAPLDTEVDKADIIKLDVEGMEHEVLQGARRLIRDCRPTVVFEVNLSQLRDHGTRIRNLASFFSSTNYALFIPVHDKIGLCLGRVPLLSLVAFWIMPGAFLLNRTSSTFDVIAVSKEKLLPLRCRSSWWTVGKLIIVNMKDKVERAKSFVHRSWSLAHQ